MPSKKTHSHLIQRGGQEPNAVVAEIIRKRTATNTPFITNTGQETRRNRYHETQPQPQPLPQTESEIKSQSQTQSQRKASASASTRRDAPSRDQPYHVHGEIADDAQPAFKFEMYQPCPANRQVPTGIYSPTIPYIELPGQGKYSASNFKLLGEPGSVYNTTGNFRMPIQQVTNINLPGPTGSHVEMNRIYENVLPTRDGKFTATTINERLQAYAYIRQILIQRTDGEDISFDNGTGNEHSIMSEIKFMELNPNYHSILSDNPYRGLPKGLLIYRSCFPVRVDKLSRNTTCSPDSVGLGVRIYALNISEYMSREYLQTFYLEYDVWRELAYYEYIRQNVIKNHRSPNFPLLYAHFMCRNRKIDFFLLGKTCLSQRDALTLDYQKYLQADRTLAHVKALTQCPDATFDEKRRQPMHRLPDERDPALQAYSGCTLLLVTEMATHNLYQWTSRIYEKLGIVHKMTSHGFHFTAVWYSILFQIIAALYVLQTDGIYIRDMTIQDNIYIKDMGPNIRSKGYWRYVINDISYYIPNHGYLVMIDSNYKEIIPAKSDLSLCKREYRIYTHNIIGKKYKLDDIRKKVYNNYRAIVTTNAFTVDQTQAKVNKPPEAVLALITAMMNDTTTTNLGEILMNHFRFYMHNRIGTFLNADTEVKNMRDVVEPFSKGDLAIEVLGEGIYKWCLIAEVKTEGKILIITRQEPDSRDFFTRTVLIDTLKQYPKSESVVQKTTPENVLSEEDQLEVYQLKGY